MQGTLKNGGNIQTPHYFLANTGVREQNFSTAIGYRKTDIGVEVFYSQFHTNLGIFSGAHIGSTTDLLEVIQKGEPFIRSDFYRNIEKPNQQINHHLLKIKAFYLLKGNRINLTIGRQFNRRAEYDLHRTTNANQPALLFRLTTHTADLIFEHKPVAKKISGQIGLSSLYQYNFNDGRPLIPDFEQTNMGLFAIERWLHQRWEIEAGLRYDWRKMDIFRFVGNVLNPTEKRFRNASGTLGAVYHAHEMLTFRLNIGSAWRPPNMSELYSKGVHHGAAAYEEGSDALQPEVALNTISSIEYAHPRFRAELGFYYNAIQNFIYLKPQNEPILTIRGAFPYFKYVQTQATFTGLDLDTEWEMIPQKLIHTQKLSYLRGYDIGTDNFLVLIPANRIDNGLSWQFGKVFLWDDVRLSIHHLWVDKQRRTPPNSDFMPSPSAYHLWSIKIAGQLKTLHLQWSIEGQNLLNTAYRDYLNRFRYYALEQGRNLSLRIRYQL
ncbi:MAG: TonB-dependent receptor [Spirosomataceae bacterium]